MVVTEAINYRKYIDPSATQNQRIDYSRYLAGQSGQREDDIEDINTAS